LKEYPVLKNEHTGTQNSTMTIPAIPKNQISGSQNHGDSLLRQYQIIKIDFLPSGTVTASTDVRNYLKDDDDEEEEKNTTHKTNTWPHHTVQKQLIFPRK
jgi:hypothetical protein